MIPRRRPLAALGLLLLCARPAAAKQVVSPTFLKNPQDSVAPVGDAVIRALEAGFHFPQLVSGWVGFRAFAARNPSLVRQYAELGARDPTLFAHVASVLGSDSAFVAAALLLASTDRRSQRVALAAVPDPSRGEAEIALSTFHDLARDAFVASGTVVRVFADGAVRGVATSGDSGSARTGSLGISIERSNRSIITASLSIASSVDTVVGGFGQRILLPQSGSALASGLLDARFSRAFLCSRPVVVSLPLIRKQFRPLCLLAPDHMYVAVAKSPWRITDTSGTSTFSATTVGFSFLYVINLFNQVVQDNPVAVTLEQGIAWRGLNGDFAQPKYDTVRTNVLTTRQTGYLGFQFGLQMTFGAITGSIDYFFLFGRRLDGLPRATVSGLTQSQVAAGFRVDVPIFIGRP